MKLDDLSEILHYQVLGLLTLIINEQVMSVGRIPNQAQIIEWLREQA